MTAKEAHSVYLSEHGADNPVGKSKFAELRPSHVKFISDMPENVCLCIHHENPNYLLAGIKSVVSAEFPV